jgi:hypothetical protein
MRGWAHWSRVLGLAIAAAALAHAAPAQADGGFPDPRQILLPVERPQQVIVATNFGLLFSEDSGATWAFSCEQPLAAYAGPYLLTPPPAQRLVAVAPSAGLVYSDDESCTWQAARGNVASVLPYALAVDPSDSMRVFVVGVPRDDLHGGESIYVSHDGGATFGQAIFTAPPEHALLGVLVAPNQPTTLLAALFSGTTRHASLLRSEDQGTTWQVVADHSETFGENPFDLLAIDPSEPARLFARVLASPDEFLAISDDGGASFRLAASVPGKLNAFLQLESGTLLVAGQSGTEAVAYRSTDRGHTFEPWASAPRVHALAERAGRLYLAADNYLDGYAIGESADEGATIRPLAGFKDVSTVKSCVSAACAKSCAYQAGINLWPEAVCGAEAPTEPVLEAGAKASGGGEPSNEGGRSADAPLPSVKPRALGGGCACNMPSAATSGADFVWLVGALLTRRRRRCVRAQLQPTRSVPSATSSIQ